METQLVHPAYVEPGKRSRARVPLREPAPRPAPTGHQAPPGHARQTAIPPLIFNSVACAVAGAPTDQAARYQAAMLASPGAVELIPATRLTRDGLRELGDGCHGHDLLVLGGGAAAFRAVEAALIPVLVARRCPLGTAVTDTIVVPIDDSSESNRALEFACLLAAAHRGTVNLLVAPHSDPAIERAIAASVGVVLGLTGVDPRLFGEPRPPERVIPSAAAALEASLVVLDGARSRAEKRTSALIAGAVGCSVLSVPRL